MMKNFKTIKTKTLENQKKGLKAMRADWFKTYEMISPFHTSFIKFLCTNATSSANQNLETLVVMTHCCKPSIIAL